MVNTIISERFKAETGLDQLSAMETLADSHGITGGRNRAALCGFFHGSWSGICAQRDQRRADADDCSLLVRGLREAATRPPAPAYGNPLKH